MQIISKSLGNGLDLGQTLHLDMCWHANHKDEYALMQIMHVAAGQTMDSLRHTS